MSDPENNWPLPTPMSKERKGQVALIIVKAMNHDGSLVDVIGRKDIPLSLEEKMEFLEALDDEEPSAQEVVARILSSKHADVHLPSATPCRECDTNVIPQVMTGIRICPTCKQPLIG